MSDGVLIAIIAALGGVVVALVQSARKESPEDKKGESALLESVRVAVALAATADARAERLEERVATLELRAKADEVTISLLRSYIRRLGEWIKVHVPIEQRHTPLPEPPEPDLI